MESFNKIQAEIKHFMKENSYSFNEDWLNNSLDEYFKKKNVKLILVIMLTIIT